MSRNLALPDARRLLDSVAQELHRGLVGQDDLVRGLLIALLADGHILIEGVPGLGKTRAVNLLAKICNLAFQRIQFTPDLLPADLVGTRVYDRETSGFRTVRGPVFTNLLLADEINRAPAKVQSALLETMQERQVTIGRETQALPVPFRVFATMNPIEQEGTYPLPEAQLDRFLLKLVVGYPKAEEERNIVRMVMDEVEAPDLEALLEPADVSALAETTRSIHVESALVDYATELVQATRRPADYKLELGPYVELGASPRASIALVQAARAIAVLDGRAQVVPDDVKAVARGVLRHRILITYVGQAESVTSESIVAEILETVKVP
ncbi:MAG: MoxR family ATPase [Thermoanaerobaculia bacterium]|nr:MoxR family ATPase [Thermoanaerobaculia bacterium]